MKLCKDCIYFRNIRGTPDYTSIPKCYHSQAISSREPVYGQYIYTPCIIMRDSLSACGPEGKLHQTK